MPVQWAATVRVSLNVQSHGPTEKPQAMKGGVKEDLIE
jgi:hypothetical protein